MSRSRFMSLPELWWPAKWPGFRTAAFAPAPAPVVERLDRRDPPDLLDRPGRRDHPERRDRRNRPRITVLRLAAVLEPAVAELLTEAVLARVLACGRDVGTVVLDLGPGTEIEAESCAALHALHDCLRRLGTRLRLAAASAQARELFRSTGLTHQLGAGAIHPSLRSAVLATYAELPGPGLVTGDVRAALAKPAHPLALAPPADG